MRHRVSKCEYLTYDDVVLDAANSHLLAHRREQEALFSPARLEFS
jgi:hypothetical protein